MIRIIALVILWSLPWSPAYLINLYSIDFEFQCNDYFALAEYHKSGNTIRVCPDALLKGELRRVVIHESQHHLQWVKGMDDWQEFESVAVMVAKKGDYTEHQRNSILAQVGKASNEPWANELHAELPNILGLDMPEPLCPWYPWFCED